MGRSFNYERAALILCDAMLMGDRAAAQKWGVTQRTVQKHRRRLENDEQLRTLTNKYRSRQIDKWLETLPEVIYSVTEFIRDSSQKLSPSDPAHLHEMVRALETLFDVKTTQSVIDARLGRNQD